MFNTREEYAHGEEYEHELKRAHMRVVFVHIKRGQFSASEFPNTRGCVTKISYGKNEPRDESQSDCYVEERMDAKRDSEEIGRRVHTSEYRFSMQTHDEVLKDQLYL